MKDERLRHSKGHAGEGAKPRRFCSGVNGVTACTARGVLFDGVGHTALMVELYIQKHLTYKMGQKAEQQ